MSLTLEERLISAVITAGDISTLTDRGLDSTWLYNPDQAAVLDWIYEHHRDYGVVPKRATLLAEWPTYTLVTVTESIEYLVDKVAENCRAMTLTSVINDTADLIERDEFEDGIEQIAAGLIKVGQYAPRSTRLVDITLTTAERWDSYKKRAAGTGTLGYATGFPTIDKATMGLQKGQLVTVLAQPKVGKTSLCLAIANHIFTTYEVPILFATFEMGVDELAMRLDSLVAGVNFTDLQAGRLSSDQELEFEKHLAIWKSYPQAFNFMDAASGSNVSSLAAQVVKCEPAVLFVDGVYMLTDEITGDVNTAQALTNVTRALKQLALRSDIPVVVNTQALASKSKGAKIVMESAGYTSSFGQDSDVLLGMERLSSKAEEEKRYATERILKILASRNTGLAETMLDFNWAEGIIQEQL